MFKDLLLKYYPKLLETDDKDILDKLDAYYNLLVYENKYYNLTAIREEKDIVIKHFYDSLIYSEHLKLVKGMKVIDIGTGAGFPGLLIAILNPDVSFTLVDSVNKKVNFLNIVIDKLSLKNVVTLNKRSELLGKDLSYRENFDIGIARSVAYLPTLSEYILPLIKVGGKMILSKEMPIEEELLSSKKALEILGGKLINQYYYKLPEFINNRIILEFEKIYKTPKTYPRREGIPKKKPL